MHASYAQPVTHQTPPHPPDLRCRYRRISAGVCRMPSPTAVAPASPMLLSAGAAARGAKGEGKKGAQPSSVVCRCAHTSPNNAPTRQASHLTATAVSRPFPHAPHACTRTAPAPAMVPQRLHPVTHTPHHAPSTHLPTYHAGVSTSPPPCTPLTYCAGPATSVQACAACPAQPLLHPRLRCCCLQV